MRYDVVVAGGGIAGMTAAAYLRRAGRSVLLCERGERLGGLVGSFERDGFVFDGGIRAMENSGIVFPMIKDLGLTVGFVKSSVTIGVEDCFVNVNGPSDVEDYRLFLKRLYPASAGDVDLIIGSIRKVMGYMDVLYAIDNPAFLDLKKDPQYAFRVLLPWLFKYLSTIGKIDRLNGPVEDHLRKMTSSGSLIDIIAQHFFRQTPTFFAMSYFKLYMDYNYPLGGTGRLVEAMESHLKDAGVEIMKRTGITGIDLGPRTVRDSSGRSWEYGNLIWAADQKQLYNCVDGGKGCPSGTRRLIEQKKELIRDKRGGDSVLTLYLSVNKSPAFFSAVSAPHFFYTPARSGLAGHNTETLDRMLADKEWLDDKVRVKDWLRKYFELTTYEISIPVLRDASLAPEGKTGLVVSALFSYDLCAGIRERGWLDEFKGYCETVMTEVLEKSIYPGLSSSVMNRFSSTPLLLSEMTGNTDGAITGWAFTNKELPSVHRMSRIFDSVDTGMPGVYQAGQWTFSPSGLPISILTGKLAADRVLKAKR